MELTQFAQKVFVVRGQRVMLDRDVAEALGVETNDLNENAKRSPKWEFIRGRGVENAYRFQLTEEEKTTILRPQSAAANMVRTLPWVYTEDGCAYFGTSLSSEEACMLAVKLSKAYVEKQRVLDAPVSPRVTLARETTQLREEVPRFIKTDLEISALLGCTPSVSRALAVQAVHRELGVDVKSYLVENVADVQDVLATPTQIGAPFDMTAQEVNKRLGKAGYQTKTVTGWHPTEKGKEFCQWLNTGKQHSDGTSIHQLKWYKEKLMSQKDWI